MAKQTLEQWIRQTASDDTKGAECTAIALVHMRGATEKELHSVTLIGRQWDFRELAVMFKNRAESYSEDLMGSQLFQLLGFYGGSKEPQAHKPFRIHGGAGDGEGLGTEEPTKAGILSQTMRHHEAMARIYTHQAGQMFEANNRTIELLSARNVSLMQENKAHNDLIMQLVLAQADKRHEHRMKELDHQRSTEERKTLMRAAPALLNSITGKEIFPQSSADTALVDMLIGHLMTLGEEGMMKMAGALNLPPQLMGSLAARAKQFIDEKELEHHALANGNDSDGEPH